jgi:cytochrome P450
MLLLLAGNETITNLLGGMFDTLARNPDSYNRIRADHHLIPMAIEEQLRFSSPAQNLFRTARADYPVGSVTIPAGARVMLSFGAANRDPRVFDDPEVYEVDRNPSQHIAFGFGAHLCLGAQLTRMEAQGVLRELVTRVSRIELVGQTRWSTNSSLRGPAQMRVKLTPA